MRIAISISITGLRRRRNGIITTTMTGLTDAGVYGDEARPDDHASIAMVLPGGVTVVSQSWGRDGRNSDEFGTGSSPTSYTPPSAGTVWTLTGTALGSDGRTYVASAPIRYAPATVGTPDSLSYADDSGLQQYDFSSIFTGTNLILGPYTVESIDPANVYIVSAISPILELDTDDLAVQSGTAYTLGTVDQYGRAYEAEGDFTIATAAQPTITGATSDRGGLAARHSVALTGVASGTPDAVKWQTDDNEAFTSPTDTGDTDTSFTPTIGTTVTDAHWVRFAAQYGATWYYSTAYQARYQPASAAGALADKEYAQDIAIVSLASASDFTIPSGITSTWSIAGSGDALHTGLSLNTGTAVTTGTPTVSGARNIVVRHTDQYGWPTDSGRTITVAPITFTVDAGNLIADIPTDTNPAAEITSVTVDDGDYAGTYTTDGNGNAFTVGGFLALGSGVGLPITKPVISLSTDTGTTDELDSGDVAEVDLAALWAAADGDTLSHTLSWRDSSGSLQANHSPYTGGGTEDTEIFARDVVGAVTVDSDPIPVVSAAGVSDPVLLDTKTIASLVGSTHTFASVDMSGAAEGDTIYFLVGFGGATATILSASMAGTTISTVRLENTTNRRVAIFKGARPAASSADFAVLMSGSSGIAGEALAVYKVVGANTDTVNSGQTSTNPVTFGVNTQIDNICLGGFIETRGTGSITLTGLSNTTTTTTTDDATFDFVTGWHRATTAETPRTFTGTMVGNGNAAGAVTVISA
jgi:hypothetical protein